MKLILGFKALFLYNDKVDKLLLAVFLVINLLVLTNSILHNPEMGYDASDHLAYIQVLPYRLPIEDDTREFFSPPLPYFLPSFVDKACIALNQDQTPDYIFETCRKASGKAAQLINFAISIGITLLFIQICEIVRPNSRSLKISALTLLGLMTVYYKTFSQARGEPYVALFAIWSVFKIAKMIRDRDRVGWKEGVTLGIILGLLGLSRQWGFMVFPAVAGLAALVWLFEWKNGWRFSLAILASFVVALLVCGWWYWRLTTDYDNLLAFNKSAQKFSFSNQPYSFYRHTGFEDFMIFRSPTRRTFDNLLIPIFYSEVWGDYWGYFVFIRDKSYLGELGFANQQQITSYLGRVNAVSLYPSLIFFAGILLGLFSLLKLFRGRNLEKDRAFFNAFLLMILLSSLVIFMYFLISYPDLGQGATIKATYILHALILLPFLGAEVLEKVKAFQPKVYLLAMALLGLVFIHNLPALITRYRMFFL